MASKWIKQLDDDDLHNYLEECEADVERAVLAARDAEINLARTKLSVLRAENSIKKAEIAVKNERRYKQEYVDEIERRKNGGEQILSEGLES